MMLSMLRNSTPAPPLRPLAGGVEDDIVRSLRQIMRAVDIQSRRLSEEYGLTGPQLVTLREVRRSGRVAASTLARAVHLSGATMTGILRRLENRGLVSRSRGTTDRRTLKVELTDAGGDVVDRVPSPLQDTFRNELEKLEEWELIQILGTLKRVAFMMDATSIPAAPHLVAGAIEPEVRVPEPGALAAPDLEQENTDES